MSKDEGIYLKCIHTEGDHFTICQMSDKVLWLCVSCPSEEPDSSQAIMVDRQSALKLKNYLEQVLSNEP